jgi:hypothetical protein
MTKTHPAVHQDDAEVRSIPFLTRFYAAFPCLCFLSTSHFGQHLIWIPPFLCSCVDHRLCHCSFRLSLSVWPCASISFCEGFALESQLFAVGECAGLMPVRLTARYLSGPTVGSFPIMCCTFPHQLHHFLHEFRKRSDYLSAACHKVCSHSSCSRNDMST